MRTDDSDDYRPVRRVLRRLISAPAALSILWPALLIACGYIGWHRWGSEHVASQYFGVDATKLHVTEAPDYVRSDVAETVFRDTAMEGLSLLDRQATAKIASAFSMHPWVRNVTGVRKLPGGVIDVRLDYREPVAMVVVFKQDPYDDNPYYLPVDIEGVLLPAREFASSETMEYVHIYVPGANSNNAAGMRFGNRRVESAASLAGILSAYREQAQIRSIEVIGDPRRNVVPQLELKLQDKTRLVWGSPPGQEALGEATVEMKLRRLLAGNLESGADLRSASWSVGATLHTKRR